MPNDNGSAERTVAYQVTVCINDQDQLQVLAPNLTLDRVALILLRASNRAEREMAALRTAEVLAERQRAIQIPGGPVRLPPPPGR